MKRPLFLTVWLTLMSIVIVLNLITSLLYPPSASDSLSHPAIFPVWIVLAFRVVSVINLIAIAMLWKWKKMGFYILCGSVVVVAVLNMMIMGLAGISAAIAGFIGVGILYWAMKPVWKQFKQ